MTISSHGKKRYIKAYYITSRTKIYFNNPSKYLNDHQKIKIRTINSVDNFILNWKKKEKYLSDATLMQEYLCLRLAMNIYD